MTREEFRRRVAAKISERLFHTTTVDPETLSFTGDEDGDFAICHEYYTDGNPIREVGYHYLTLEELMDMVCED